MTAETWAPACMEPDELADWERLNHTAMSMRAALPCADCLAEFSDEMRAEGRCNGTPRGTEGEPMDAIRVDPEVMQESRVRGGLAAAAQRVAEAKPDAVELVPETPCGTCAHALVCAWKRDLDAIGDVPVRMPELAEGLTMTLRAVVECSQYLRAPKAHGLAVVDGERPKRRLSPEAYAHVVEGNRARAERARAAKAGQQG